MATHERHLPTRHGSLAIVESGGDGPPVLLVHGNSSCKEVFRHQLEGAPGRAYHLIAMDLPGHGASSDAPEPELSYTMTGYAEAAVEVLRALNVEVAAMLGWSLVGHIGLEAIARHTEVAALMITGTPPVSPADLEAGFIPSEHMGLAGTEHFTEQNIEDFARASCGPNAPFERFLRDAVKRADGRARRLMIEAFVAGGGANQRTLVETSQIPLAVVNGAADSFVNNDYVQSVDYANLWDGRVHLLPEIGHAPFWEAPKLFDPLLLRFLRDTIG